MEFNTVDAAVAWVRELDKLLWKEEPQGYTDRVRGAPAITWSARRRIEEDELQLLLTIITTWALPVTVGSANFGFNVCMHVWSPEPPALFPGVEPELERLTVLGPAHLPLSKAQKMKDRILFADGWAFFSQYTHSETNRVLLQRCNLPAPPDIAEMMY